MAEAPAATAAPAANLKPSKPDQDLFNKSLEKAQKEYDDAMTRYVSASYRPASNRCSSCTFPQPRQFYSH